MFFGRELFLDLFGNDILIGQICFSKAVVDTWNLESSSILRLNKTPPKRRPNIPPIKIGVIRVPGI